MHKVDCSDPNVSCSQCKSIECKQDGDYFEVLKDKIDTVCNKACSTCNKHNSVTCSKCEVMQLWQMIGYERDRM